MFIICALLFKFYCRLIFCLLYVPLSYTVCVLQCCDVCQLLLNAVEEWSYHTVYCSAVTVAGTVQRDLPAQKPAPDGLESPLSFNVSLLHFLCLSSCFFCSVIKLSVLHRTVYHTTVFTVTKERVCCDSIFMPRKATKALCYWLCMVFAMSPSLCLSRCAKAAYTFRCDVMSTCGRWHRYCLKAFFLVSYFECSLYFCIYTVFQCKWPLCNFFVVSTNFDLFL